MDNRWMGSLPPPLGLHGFGGSRRCRSSVGLAQANLTSTGCSDHAGGGVG